MRVQCQVSNTIYIQKDDDQKPYGMAHTNILFFEKSAVEYRTIGNREEKK